MENTIRKLTYKTPEIDYVKIDSEITLQLNSSPPYPINERSEIMHKEYFDNEPYNMV